jgi:hypothetical protein
MKSILKKVNFSFSRNLLHVKKQSPHIFFGIGVVGMVTSTVLACRATLKLSETLDDIHTDVENVKALKNEAIDSLAHDSKVVDLQQVYSDEQYKKDMVYVYSKATVRISKLYGPSVVIGAISIAALTGSHVQLTRRNTALMAAYAAVQKAYDDYRDRVREELGSEKELDIYHAAKTEVDDNGEEQKVVDPNKMSVYSKFFDEYSDCWAKDPELNRIYITCQQQYANDLLRSRGHVFLNEVYDTLGIERTREGAVVGWIRDSKDGDNFIDFGMYEARNAAFINGVERSVLLDFNVDGVIYDKI